MAAIVTGKATVVVMQTDGRWAMPLTVTDTSTVEGAKSPSCKLALGLTRDALWKVARSKHITKPKHIKGSNERLFIRTQTHSLQIFGKLPFAKLQNDT